MAEKVKLRDYQKSILDRLDVVRTDAIQPIPLVKPWFLGVTNVRGVLYAINDLGMMLDDSATELSSDTRMVLINQNITSNVGILINRLIGLRNLSVLTKRDETEDNLCFKQESYTDEDGQVWYVLDLERLVNSKEFEVPYAV